MIINFVYELKMCGYIIPTVMIYLTIISCTTVKYSCIKYNNNELYIQYHY